MNEKMISSSHIPNLIPSIWSAHKRIFYLTKWSFAEVNRSKCKLIIEKNVPTSQTRCIRTRLNPWNNLLINTCEAEWKSNATLPNPFSNRENNNFQVLVIQNRWPYAYKALVKLSLTKLNRGSTTTWTDDEWSFDGKNNEVAKVRN